MFNGIIYKSENKINGKVYIGKTTYGLERRRKRHESNSLNDKLNYHFLRALRKHGIDNFKWETIDTAQTEQELNLLEQLYIEEYRQNGQIYNLTDGGEGMSGYRHSEESKYKMSESTKGHAGWNKGKKHTEEAKINMSKASRNMSTENRKKITSSHLKGLHPSPETRIKLSLAQKGNQKWLGKKHTKKTRLKMSLAQSGSNNAMYGKKASTETKKKMVEAHKGFKHTEESKLKMSIAGKGHKCSDEHKRKISKANSGKKRSKEMREKMSEALKGNKNCLGNKLSNEHKEKISEANVGSKNHNYGKKASEETRQNMREAQKIRREREACLCP